jgi:hypothetical protein
MRTNVVSPVDLLRRSDSSDRRRVVTVIVCRCKSEHRDSSILEFLRFRFVLKEVGDGEVLTLLIIRDQEDNESKGRVRGGTP